MVTRKINKKTNTVSTVFCGAKKFIVLEEPIREVLFFIFSYVHLPQGHCDIFLLTNKESQKIHQQFKQKDSPATVLSFVSDGVMPRPDIPFPLVHYGEIYLAPDYIRVVRGDIFSRYLIHGILHLLGYTHERTYDRMQMEKLEKKIAELLKKNLSLPKNF